MKKLLSLLTCALSVTGLTAAAAVPAYDGEAALTAARADMLNWQKYLPDNMFAAHVSMPGSHDSATGHNVTYASSSQAQDVHVDKQLEMGIRAFDLRPGFYTKTETVDGVKVTVAAPINCNHGMGKAELTFEQAFTMFTDYLTAHPTEFIAIHFFRGYPTSDPNETNQAIFNKAVDELLNTGKFNDFIIDFDPYLTVKEMRGKIVMFKRDRISWVKMDKAGNLGGWPGDKDLWTPGAAATATHPSNPTINGRIRVTDVSSPQNESELNIKLNSITNLYKANCEQPTPNEAKKTDSNYKPEWSMIFTSGEYTSGKKGYLTCATHTNPHLTKLINEAEKAGPTGMVFSDWVLLDSYNNGTEEAPDEYAVKGKDLVKAIIENNFKYAANYILDDELFNDNAGADVPDLLGNNVYFMRNVGSGKYLAAGADWGTHAVLADNGIRIRTFFDKRAGNYLLQTTFRQNGTDNYLGDNAYIDNTAPFALKAVKVEDADAYYMTFAGNEGTMALSANPTGNSYADGTTLLAEYLKYEEGNKNQQWEFITEEDLTKALAAGATAENPADLTFKIHSFKFCPNDDNETKYWVFTNERPKSSTTYCVKTQAWGSNEWNDKDMIFRVYVDKTSTSYPENYSWELVQDVTGLPEGIYTVTANAMADNMPMEGEGKLEMTANGVDMTAGMLSYTTGTYTCDKGSALDELRKPESLVKAENVEVGTDGLLKLRMAKPLKTAPGKQNFFFDNFALKYHGAKGSAGIDTVVIPDMPDAMAEVDVYNMAGVLVRTNVTYGTALDDLSRGIYIIRYGATAIKVAK